MKALARYTLAVAGFLFLGAGLGASGDAAATLIIHDIDLTVAAGSSRSVDLNEDSKNDMHIAVKSAGADIRGDVKTVCFIRDLSEPQFHAQNGRSKPEKR